MQRSSFDKKLCLITAFLAFFLVGLGGYVRATGAGLSCPDWPLCYGRAVPDDFSGGVFQEVFHRYTAFAVSILTMIVIFRSFRLSSLFPRYRNLGVFLLCVLLLQVVLGGLTVLMRLNPFIVTAHLGLGTLFAQALMLTGIEEAADKSVEIKSKRQSSLLILCSALFFLCYMQILLGGLLGSSGASLVCPDIPFCFGKFFSLEMSAAQIVHMTHRLVGISLILLMIGLCWVIYQNKDANLLDIRPLLRNILVLLAVQVTIGFSNVYFRIPVWLTVAHLVVAQVILLHFGLILKRLKPELNVLFTKEFVGKRSDGEEANGAQLLFNNSRVING